MLADVAALGPFFAVGTDPAERVDPTWRPVTDLHADPEPLRARIAHVRRALGGDDRVAASIAFQGLAARLVAPPLAAVAVHGVLPDLGPARLHWRPTATGPWPLWCADPEAVGVGEDAGALAAAVEALVGPLVGAVRAQVAVSERVLRGNVASAVAGGKRLIGQQRPAAAQEAARVAAALLDGPLAGSGDRLSPVEPDVAWSFRRRSCCLYYRVRDGGLCGDCVLLARPSPATRRRR